jgi:hypothetical protein
MDIMAILRENPRARQIILAQNEADTMRKYGLSLAQAKQVHQLAFLLEAAE